MCDGSCFFFCLILKSHGLGHICCWPGFVLWSLFLSPCTRGIVCRIIAYRGGIEWLLFFVVLLYFNKECLQNKVTLKYAQIKAPNTSPASQSTTQKARTLRIKEKLRFLHKKKETLNRELYRSHLKVAQEWGKWWDPIHESIIQK